MRRALLVCLLGVVAVACSDDKDDEVARGIRDLCIAQCERADECGLTENITPAQCQSNCENLQTQENAGDCKFTEVELHVCGDAFYAQECSAFENGEVPEDCRKTCQVVRD
jgi:hypothetical protein